jgi:hypothetical protein
MVRFACALALWLSMPGIAQALEDGCAVVMVSPGGVLSLRSGPGTTYPEVMLLRSGQFVSIDDLAGDPEGRWWHITGLLEPRPRRGFRATRRIEGWANGRYLHQINCD